MGYHLGIDAGTTYTAAAVHRDGQVEIVPLGDRAASIPSVVFLKPDGSVLTGDAAYRRGLAEPERVAVQFKRRVGDATSILLGGTPYSAEALMAKLLRWTVDKVSELQGGPPDTVAVTHPANWGGYKLDRLDQAIRMADLAGAVTLTEPEAAAIHYASNERVEPNSTIAVYDLGGGTFDVAILRKNPTGWNILGSPEGIEQLGGVDVDEAVYEHVRRTIPTAFESLDLADPATRAAITRLRRECVEAKEALSSDTDVNIAVLLPGAQTQVRLTRSELESMIGPTLEDTVGAMERALRSADVVPADVTAVLLVGGSSRIPMVAELVSSAFGRPIAVDTHPKHAIALGAALAAAADTLPAGLAAAEVPATAAGPAEAPIAVVHTEETSEDPLPDASPASQETASVWAPPGPAAESAPPPPPPTPEPVPVPLPLDGDGDDDGPNRLLLIGGVVGLLILAVVGGIFALGGGGGGDDDDSADSDRPGAEVPAENTDLRLVSGRAFPTGRFPDGIAIGPNGNAWVATTGDDQVLRLDPRTGRTQSVPIQFDASRLPPEGPDPLALTVTDDGFVWVSFRNAPFIVRIDPNTVLAAGQVGVGTEANALVQAGRSLLVSTTQGVDVVDLDTMQRTATIEVASPAGIAVTEDAATAWVVSRAESTVVQVDLSTNELTGSSLSVGSEPDGVAIDGEGNLWVTNRGEGTVSRIDPSTAERQDLEVGTSPADIAFDGEFVWLTDNGEGTLILIDPAAVEVAERIDVGPNPLDIAVRPGAIAVSVSGDDTVQVVLAATTDTEQPFAEMTDLREEDDRYVFDYRPINYAPEISGELHTHFFWNTTPPIEAGGPEGTGDWLLWDDPFTVSDAKFDVSERPAGATAICSIVVDVEHQISDVTGDGEINYSTGNCIKLPR